MASTDAKATAYWGVAHRLYFPILDADGDLVTGATGLDSEISKDAGNFADCTNEATEIQSTGMYYLDLTATEMEADAVVIQVKTTSSGAKTTVLVIYTEQGTRTRKATAGANGSITLDASASSTDDIYNDQLVAIVGGTGAGQVRRISDYVGSTQVASVEPNWATNPDNTSIFHLIRGARVDVGSWVGVTPNALVSGRVDSRVGAIASGAIDAAAIADDAIDAGAIAANAITSSKIADNAITAAKIADNAIDAGSIASDAITAAKIASNAITSAKIASDAITSAKIADDAITAAKIATGAIDADALAADAVTEIQSGLALSTQVDDVESGVTTLLSRLTALRAAYLDLLNTNLDVAVSSRASISDVSGYRGTAQAGGAASITLDGGAYATDDYLNGMVVFISSGTGNGQARLITDYDGTTKVATVTPAWAVNPDNTSSFHIRPCGPADVRRIADGTISTATAPPLATIISDISGLSSDLQIIYDALETLINAVPTGDENADALLDRASAIDGYTVREILRVAAAALAGKSSGGASDDVLRAIDDSKARITVSVDGNGHRTEVTVDAT